MAMDCSFCLLLSEFWKISNLGRWCLIYTNRGINVTLIMVIIIMIMKLIIMIIKNKSLILSRPNSSNKVKIFDRSFTSKALILTYLFIKLGHSNNAFHVICYGNRPHPNTGAEFNRFLVPSLKKQRYADTFVVGWLLIR